MADERKGSREGFAHRQEELERLAALWPRLIVALEPFAAFACGSDDGSGIPLDDCDCHNCNAARLVSRARHINNE